MILLAVERYNPQENRWHTVAPMGTRRKHLGCAVYQDMIYSVGGRDDTTELSSAERYNPRTNQWSPVVAMTSRRSGVCESLNLFQPLKKELPSKSVLSVVLGWFSSSKWPVDGSWRIWRYHIPKNNRSLWSWCQHMEVCTLLCVSIIVSTKALSCTIAFEHWS